MVYLFLYIIQKYLCKKVDSPLRAVYGVEIHEGVKVFVEYVQVPVSGQGINACKGDQVPEPVHTVIKAVPMNVQHGGCRGGMEAAVKPGPQGFIVMGLFPAVILQENTELRNNVRLIQRVLVQHAQQMVTNVLYAAGALQMLLLTPHQLCQGLLVVAPTSTIKLTAQSNATFRTFRPVRFRCILALCSPRVS